MNLDQTLLAFFNYTLAHPISDALMAAITLVAMPGIFVVPLVLLLGKHTREGWTLLTTIVFSALLSVGLQFIFRRLRPIDVRAVLPMSSFPSFPSGHAAAFFSAALLLALRWPRSTLPAFTTAIVVSLSRACLGQHFPSDIFGGAIVGLGVAAVIYGYTKPASIGRPRWTWLLWGQLAAVVFISLTAYLDLINLGFLTLPGADKVLHFGLSGALAFFGVSWWVRQPARYVLVALSGLAIIEEAAQALSPVRSFDLWDLACTLGGIVCLGLLACRVSRRRSDMAV
ncbi:MAG: phosphatase PAP2 family protein [Anaerolineae bacterium]|nr:phosphatase PAP2 family protein [Anaerolineae bacterium]